MKKADVKAVLFCEWCGHMIPGCDGCNSVMGDDTEEVFCDYEKNKKHYCLDCEQ